MPRQPSQPACEKEVHASATPDLLAQIGEAVRTIHAYAGGSRTLLGEVSGLDDFELVSFLVVKEAE